MTAPATDDREGPAADDTTDRLMAEANTQRQQHQRTDLPATEPILLEALIRQADMEARVVAIERATQEEVLAAAIELIPADTDQKTRRRIILGTQKITDWLLAFPGDTWQDRWVLGDGDHIWTAEMETPSGPHGWKAIWTRRLGLASLINLRLVHPSMEWLIAPGHAHVTKNMLLTAEPVWEARLRESAAALGLGNRQTICVLRDIGRLCIRTGKVPDALTPQDFAEAHTTIGELTRVKKDAQVAATAAGEQPRPRAQPQVSFKIPFAVARQVGILPATPVNLYAALNPGQLTVEELVDQYGVQSAVGRYLLVNYISSRQAEALDYTSLQSLTNHLVKNWWCQIERLSPDGPPSDMRIMSDVADAWRAWLKEPPREGAPKRTTLPIMRSVRGFYAWLNDGADAEPERYGPYAARCFILRSDLAGGAKVKRQRKAVKDQGTRKFAAAEQKLRTFLASRLVASRERLALAQATAVGETFTYRDTTWIRVKVGGLAGKVRAQREAGGSPVDLEHEEDEAFWSWAIVEAFCIVGIRIEELLELTIFDFIPYLLPDGRVIPLLHINPSKSDSERLIPLMKEEAAVFSAIKRRITLPDGTVPAVSRYDHHERMYSPELPHLFQRYAGLTVAVPSEVAIRRILARALAASNIPTLAKIRPHDFRRLFATNKLDEGVPLQVVAAIMGHRNYETTAGYAAVFPKTVISAYLNFASRKRAHRPAEETAPDPASAKAARAEFEEKFGARKVRTGECMRPFADDCKRQHNCTRCPLVDLKPEAGPIIDQQRDDARVRLTEAEANGWTAEAEGIRLDLRALADKTRRLDRRRTLAQIPGAEALAPGEP